MSEKSTKEGRADPSLPDQDTSWRKENLEGELLPRPFCRSAGCGQRRKSREEDNQEKLRQRSKRNPTADERRGAASTAKKRGLGHNGLHYVST